MKFEARICHSQLLSMLMMPVQFHKAVESYSATAPDVPLEGVNGYLEVDATFNVRDLEAFTKLYHESYVYPSDRQQWYQMILKGVDKFEERV